MKQNVLVIDLDRCIGCKGGCQVACKARNGVALGPSRSKLYSMGPVGIFPDLQMYFIPVMCQQCENPSCASVCPTGACYKREQDGVVCIDKDLCIGCKSCMRACPYEAIIFNTEMNISDKCDICATSRDIGATPACVRNCSGAAIYYGDIHDPKSEVSRLIADAGQEHVYALQDTGNNPNARFILRRAAWNKTLPHRFGTKEGGNE